MSRVIIYPYKMYSKSAKALRDSLREKGVRCLLVRADGLYRPRHTDVIINWGSSIIPHWFGQYLNNVAYVFNSINKLYCLETLCGNDISTVEFTHTVYESSKWIQEGYTVVARNALTGHSGQGIVLCHANGNPLPIAPLYTKYKKKKAEYRVHVFNGVVIDVQQKKRRAGLEQTDEQSKIRSHNNGWVFCREGLQENQRLNDLACSAIDALGLDFGAVDIIYNEKEDSYYVLEINTAVGLEGKTLDVYTQAILNLL